MQKLALYAVSASILLTLSTTEGFAKHHKSENTKPPATNVAKQPEQKSSETVQTVASKPSDVTPARSSFAVSPSKSGFNGEGHSEGVIRKYFAR